MELFFQEADSSLQQNVDSEIFLHKERKKKGLVQRIKVILQRKRKRFTKKKKKNIKKRK